MKIGLCLAVLVVAMTQSLREKYTVDSVVYRMKSYKLDGFRFDLMGLIDIKKLRMKSTK